MQDSTTRSARTSWKAAAAAATLAAAMAGLAAGPAAAFEPTERVPLAQPGSKVKGSAVVGARGNGTAVTIELKGLKPGQQVRALLLSGTCKRPSASFADIVQGKADAKGSYTAAGTVRYRGEPVSFTIVGDGMHLVSIVAGGKTVACGVIPGMD